MNKKILILVLIILILFITLCDKSSFGVMSVPSTTFYIGDSAINSNTFPSITSQITNYTYGYLTNNSSSFVVGFPTRASDTVDFISDKLYGKESVDQKTIDISNNIIVSCYDLKNRTQLKLTDNVLGNLQIYLNKQNVASVVNSNYTLSVKGNGNSFEFDEQENGKYAIIVSLETVLPVTAWYPTVYLYSPTGVIPAACSGVKQVADCETVKNSNVIDQNNCEGCKIVLELNGKCPDFLKFKVYNCEVKNQDGSLVVPDSSGDYIEPIAFINNYSVNGFKYQDIVKAAKLPENSRITRIDNIVSNCLSTPGINSLIYYTTFDENSTYLSDSCIILLDDDRIFGNIVTNNDQKSILSDKKISIGYNGPTCTLGDYAHLDINFYKESPGIFINAGDSNCQKFDYNFLRIIPLAGRIPLYMSGATGAEAKYGCGFDWQDISDSITNPDLTLIMCEVSTHNTIYIILEVNFLDTKLNLIKQYRCSA